MAVAQHKTTRSRRNQRRSHDKLTCATLAIHSETGETHLRHHVTADGYDLRGRQVIATATPDEDEA